MGHTNAQKLSAVLVKWLEPMMGQLASMKVESLPFLGNIQEKMRSSGWVSKSYCITDDLSPIMGGVIGAMVEPTVYGMLQGVPDETLPVAVRKIVDAAVKNGGLVLLEGKVSFSRDDVEQLARMVDRNLPISDDMYEVEL